MCMKRWRKIIKALGIMIFMLLIIVVIAHVVGRAWNKRTPRDGINESMVVDVNGSRQWINIYGQNKKNPVLVYLQEDSRGYLEFFRSDAFESFSIKDKFVYSVPYININGDMDFQANYQLAQNYYEGVIAPAKDMIIMKNTSHGLLESKSEEFSNVVHDIFEKYKRLYK